MNIAILGFGREGKVALSYWSKKYLEAAFTIYDKDESIESAESATLNVDINLNKKNLKFRLGENYKNFLLEDLENIDLIIKSPGISILDIEDKVTKPITSITKEFFDICPATIIGVTGTKGKGTTATLIYKILKEEGKDVYLVGNIGVPALEVSDKINKDSYVVYELSSFQLYDLKKSPHIAVCLTVTEDHLDWHHTLLHYQNAKSSIFKYQKENYITVYYKDNSVSTEFAKLSAASTKISYGESGDVKVSEGGFYFNDEYICEVSEVALPGKHNEQNICAAIAATHHIASRESIVKVLKRFGGLAYHTEYKGSIDGVRYINDSFSTNPTSGIVAIDAFASKSDKENLIVILGGVDRGLDLGDLKEKLLSVRNLKNILLYGDMGERLSSEMKQELSETRSPLFNKEGPQVIEFNESILNKFIYLERDANVIFEKAKDLAETGDTILFSPSAPSFDMFSNYIKRGEAFNEYFGF